MRARAGPAAAAAAVYRSRTCSRECNIGAYRERETVSRWKCIVAPDVNDRVSYTVYCITRQRSANSDRSRVFIDLIMFSACRLYPVRGPSYRSVRCAVRSNQGFHNVSAPGGAGPGRCYCSWHFWAELSVGCSEVMTGPSVLRPA